MIPVQLCFPASVPLDLEVEALGPRERFPPFVITFWWEVFGLDLIIVPYLHPVGHLDSKELLKSGGYRT